MKNNTYTNNGQFSEKSKESLRHQDISRKQGAPFIHKVQTDHNKYIYDSNTGEILRVDDIVWDIIEDFGSLPKERIVAKYVSKYQPDEISAAYDQITDAQKDGLLLFKRPKVIFKFGNKLREIARQLMKNREELILNVTEACNFRCSYCRYTINSNAHRRHSNHMMSWNTAQAAIDDFLSHCGNNPKAVPDFPAVRFHGGEPLLNFPLIKRCVRYIRKKIKPKNIQFLITTNGSLLNDETADFLAAEGFVIVVSFDGPKHIHDKNRRTKAGSETWAVVTENIKGFLDKHPKYKNNPNFRINAVLTPNVSAAEFDEFFRNCDFTRHTHIRTEFMRSSGRINLGVFKQGKSIMEEVDKLHAKYLCSLVEGKSTTFEFRILRPLFEEQYKDVHRRNYVPSQDRYFPDNYTYPFATSMCMPGIRMYYVSVKGDYFPCSKIPECEQLKIGDIHKGIDPEKVYKLVKQFFECNQEDCNSCWCLRMCKVGCYIDICEGYILTEKMKKKACEKHREERHQALINYCAVLEKNRRAFEYLEI